MPFMLRNHLFCYALFLIFLVGTFPAAAASKKGEALIHPVYEQDGQFGFCLFENPYKDGRSMTLAISPSDNLNIGIMIPEAGFTLGRHYDLDVSLEDKDGVLFLRLVRGVALDANSLVLQMGKNADFEDALGQAVRLNVEAKGRKVTFDIPAMNPVLKKLRTCNIKNKGKVNREAANAEKALPDTLKALLVEAGFKDFIPLRMDDIPADKRPADFMWQIGSVYGGVRERMAPKEKGFSELVGLYIDGLKKQCAGNFDAELGREVSESGLTMRLADVRCQNKDQKGKSVVGSIIFYVTATNKFTVFTHEAPIDHEAEAKSVRDALYKTLVGLAREAKGRKN